MNLRTFCLTLRDFPERTDQARKHFSEQGMSVEFIFGLNADKAGLKATLPYEVDAPNSGFIMGPYKVGIWLAHYIAWQVCSACKEDAFLILEDDVRFVNGWMAEFAKAEKRLPNDWDFLFLGSCNARNKPSEHLGDNLYDVRWPHCLHAYVVRKKGVRYLLETQERVWAPIDLSLIFSSFPQMKVFTILPRLADQANTPIEH